MVIYPANEGLGSMVQLNDNIRLEGGGILHVTGHKSGWAGLNMLNAIEDARTSTVAQEEFLPWEREPSVKSPVRTSSCVRCPHQW